MIPRLGDGNYEDVYPHQCRTRLENDSPSRGRKQVFGLLLILGYIEKFRK